MDFSEHLDNNPILRISIYLDAQVKALFDMATSIDATLNETFKEGKIDATSFIKVNGLFWLWVLGAFEVVRTLQSDENYLTKNKRSEIKRYKSRLIRLRSPMAKHQLSGKTTKVKDELSVEKFDVNAKDFCFEIEGEEYWVRRILNEFQALINSIRSNDIHP